MREHRTTPPHRAIVEAMKLHAEKAKRAKVAAAGGEPEDPELLARIALTRDGMYKRMKLLATWADLDDEQVCVRVCVFFACVSQYCNGAVL